MTIQIQAQHFKDKIHRDFEWVIISEKGKRRNEIELSSPGKYPRKQTGENIISYGVWKMGRGGDLSGFEGRHYKTEDHKGRYDHEMEMSFNECWRTENIFLGILEKGRKKVMFKSGK